MRRILALLGDWADALTDPREMEAIDSSDRRANRLIEFRRARRRLYRWLRRKTEPPFPIDTADRPADMSGSWPERSSQSGLKVLSRYKPGLYVGDEAVI